MRPGLSTGVLHHEPLIMLIQNRARFARHVVAVCMPHTVPRRDAIGAGWDAAGVMLSEWTWDELC